MTHTEKDCVYAPRKRGAWKTNKDIMPDEYINKELHLSYEGKRDRWNGFAVAPSCHCVAQTSVPS